jgi:hypothetical protein
MWIRKSPSPRVPGLRSWSIALVTALAALAAPAAARAQALAVPPPDAPAAAAPPLPAAPPPPDAPAAVAPQVPESPAAAAMAAAAAPLNAQASVRSPSAGILNPDTSVIIDGDFGYYGRHAGDFATIGIPAAGDDPSPARQGFTLQEVELAFSAPIDPYLEGALFLTIPNLDGLEIEEGYLQTTSLPFNLQIKAGSFRSQVGRNNSQHLHVQNFTRRPLMIPTLFGIDGFRGPGAQASLLLPGLPWFATLYAEAFSIPPPDPGVPPPVPAVAATFGGGGRSPANLAYTGVLEQFWSPTEATSLLLGLNFATAIASLPAAPPGAAGPRDYFYGADLYFKWRPPDVVGEGKSFAWSTEFFARTITEGGPTEGAFYTEPVVQLAKRWYFAGRFDLAGVPAGPNVPRRYGTALSLTFAPTEFSRFRLYGQELWGPGAQNTLIGFIQTEISMGAHGAHAF